MMHNTKFLSLFSKGNIVKLPTNGTKSDRIIRKMASWINFGFSLIFSGLKRSSYKSSRRHRLASHPNMMQVNLKRHWWLRQIISRIAKIQFLDSDISLQQTMLLNASSSLFLDHRSGDRPIHLRPIHLTILQQRGFNPPFRNIENQKHPSFFQS